LPSQLYRTTIHQVAQATRAAFYMAAHVPTQRDYEKLAEFRTALNGFLAFSDAAARAAGLVPRQHQALLMIKGFARREPITAGRLAKRLGIQHHSAVGLIDRLAAKGLIRRRTDPADRRQVRLELTPKAANLLVQLSVTHRDELKRTAPLLRDFLAHLDSSSSPEMDR